MVALDPATGEISGRPTPCRRAISGVRSGAAEPSYDAAHKLVYLATGKNFMVPQPVLACLASGGASAACMSPGNHFDSIIALDVSTGAIAWGARGLPSDVWSVACGLNVPGFQVGPGFPGVYGNCPNGQPATAGPDYDFSQGPMLFGGNNGDNQGGNLVSAGQKSGMFGAFNAKTGKLAWSRQVAPGGVTGGLQWGSSTDGRSIFVAASYAGPSTNGGGVGALPWTLKDGTTTTSGGWAALDANTVATPNSVFLPAQSRGPPVPLPSKTSLRIKILDSSVATMNPRQIQFQPRVVPKKLQRDGSNGRHLTKPPELTGAAARPIFLTPLPPEQGFRKKKIDCFQFSGAARARSLRTAGANPAHRHG